MKPKGKYIEHITESEKKARSYGDQQVLVAGDKGRSKIKKKIVKKMK